MGSGNKGDELENELGGDRSEQNQLVQPYLHPTRVKKTKESPSSCSGNDGDELENELGGDLFDRALSAASTTSSPNSCSRHKGDELENEGEGVAEEHPHEDDDQAAAGVHQVGHGDAANCLAGSAPPPRALKPPLSGATGTQHQPETGSVGSARQRHQTALCV